MKHLLGVISDWFIKRQVKNRCVAGFFNFDGKLYALGFRLEDFKGKEEMAIKHLANAATSLLMQHGVIAWPGSVVTGS